MNDIDDPYVGRTPGEHQGRDPSDCYRERVAAQDEWRMQHEQDRCILVAMLTHGSHFEKQLAGLGFAADNGNLSRLKAAWPEIWEQFKRMCNERR